MAADIAHEIVKLAVGTSPVVRVYHDPDPEFGMWFDEVIVRGKIVTNMFVANNEEFNIGVSRSTRDPDDRVKLMCNDPIAATRIALQTKIPREWAISVNGLKVYRFGVDDTKQTPLDEQLEFRDACQTVLSYR